ncbi:MAG: glycogen debranching protein GlgX [Burkholderiales bacterium]|nr:glycogen debranching protein GlgX [Burkholderiales bacterium]
MITPLRGQPSPLGATPGPDGVNFSVYSRAAQRVELLLYDDVDDAEPRRVISLESRRHRSYHYWHVFVPGLRPGQLYAWRAYGPFEPDRGQRFDSQKVLLDPYGRAVARPSDYRRAAAQVMGRNDRWACKSVVVDMDRYDWEGDAPLRRPFAQTIIYEMHVGGFTRHPSSGLAPELRGTYAGLVQKIPYLKDLGITAVELLPVFQFDEQDAPAGLTNYWGYSPMSFFAPHGGYSRCGSGAEVLDEFRDMVKALHRAGIEVILDVVYNHTTENDEHGPTQSLRGLDNRTYYMLEPGRRYGYANYSGTGNTLNANHAVVRRLITDSLHFWVRDMHVDGFRFDLASILSRDESGRPLSNPPVLWDIESDPVLAGTKLIAEAWDAAGLYQVGSFVGDSWKEWNGQFRDDVRAFVRGDAGLVARVADRLMGSPQLYGGRPREPAQSINFITSHDGFTLNDLVSYNEKHNEANGEHNRDGHNHNLSWNCGVEGPTNDPAVEALRARQVRNCLSHLILSLGTPMLLMGDEVRRTQGGNNNAYCQDNATSWFDWTLLQRHADILRWVKGLIALRNLRESVRTDHHLTLAELMSIAQVELHGVALGRPDLAHDSHSLAITASSLSGDLRMHFAINAYWEPLDFELPALPPSAVGGWRRVVDSSRPSPQDLVEPRLGEPVSGPTHRVAERSVVVLFAQVGPAR